MAFCDGLLSDKDAFDASWKAVKEPVSYTHLDVYKRQVPKRVRMSPS